MIGMFVTSCRRSLSPCYVLIDGRLTFAKEDLVLSLGVIVCVSVSYRILWYGVRQRMIKVIGKNGQKKCMVFLGA